jgi:hypothetical protein
MATGYIIVERDVFLKDRGVFTGQIQIVDSPFRFHDDAKTVPFQVTEGVWSTDIEHAFVFNSSATAWRHAMNFEPHFDRDRNRYWAARRWVVRKDGEFCPGQAIHKQEPLGLYAGLSNDRELMLRAMMQSFEQGQQSARREMGLIEK